MFCVSAAIPRFRQAIMSASPPRKIRRVHAAILGETSNDLSADKNKARTAPQIGCLSAFGQPQRSNPRKYSTRQAILSRPRKNGKAEPATIHYIFIKKRIFFRASIKSTIDYRGENICMQPVDLYPRARPRLPRGMFLYKAWYWAKSKIRRIRVCHPVTRLLGPQYLRSRDRIEIDITYACNLRCINCNRSVSQAPEKLHMPVDMIRRFVGDSIARNKRWKSIRVLGGEATLHPAFLTIMEELLTYLDWEPHCVLTVVTNGHGKAVNATLAKIPPAIAIENSSKTGNLQPHFGAFNMAPIDDPALRDVNYGNGCAIMHNCGMGLTPLGYYPCAVAGGIDRIAGHQLGYDSLPFDDDNMTQVSEKLCRLCGHFRDGHCVPPGIRAPVFAQQTSVSWVRLYADFKLRKRDRSDRHDLKEVA